MKKLNLKLLILAITFLTGISSASASNIQIQIQDVENKIQDTQARITGLKNEIDLAPYQKKTDLTTKNTPLITGLNSQLAGLYNSLGNLRAIELAQKK